MNLSARANKLVTEISDTETKLGDIKKLAKNIKTAHDLALELWSTGHYYARLLANQLMKNKQTVCLLEISEKHPSVIQRRLFWYYQARLRAAGQLTPKNTEALLIIH